MRVSSLSQRPPTTRLTPHSRRCTPATTAPATQDPRRSLPLRRITETSRGRRREAPSHCSSCRRSSTISATTSSTCRANGVCPRHRRRRRPCHPSARRRDQPEAEFRRCRDVLQAGKSHRIHGLSLGAALPHISSAGQHSRGCTSGWTKSKGVARGDIVIGLGGRAANVRQRDGPSLGILVSSVTRRICRRDDLAHLG